MTLLLEPEVAVAPQSVTTYATQAGSAPADIPPAPEPLNAVAPELIDGLAKPTLRDATKTWFRISLQTFGGPAGQIAVMQNKLVDEKKWLSQERFLQALGFCMLLPGPEALQLSIYLGWLFNGVLGGVIAGALFILPGVLALLALSALYIGAGTTALVTGLFLGLAPAVVAIVLQAVRKVAGRALYHRSLVGLAVASFLALTLFGLPFPVVVLAAAVGGWLLRARILPDGEAPTGAQSSNPSVLRTLRTLAIGLAVWAIPVAIAALAFGTDSVFVDQGRFFAGAAMVTFGGAYAVLAYVAQAATNVFGWLAPGEMVHGLAMAETTPGPLVTVVQFVGFVGAFRQPGALNPWVAALIGSAIVSWVTFVPSFFFIFVGAPFVERLRTNRALQAALAGITAAVVGIVANLALFFAFHNLFSAQFRVGAGPLALTLPVLTSVNWIAVGLAALASVLIFRFKWSTLKVLGVCVALGIGLTLLGIG